MTFAFSGRVRLALLVGSVVIVVAVLAPAGTAAQPPSPNCWGAVTAQRASTEHDIGEHASAQSEPRLGIGNVAELFTGSHQPGALGSLLASLDGLDATSCP
jgi:hypothetical protein